MKYKEISVLTTTEGSELIAEAFFSVGSEGVAVYDKQDLLSYLKSENNWDYVDEHLLTDEQQAVRVVGYLPESDFERGMEEFSAITDGYVRAGCFDFGSLETTVKEIGDTDYYEVWKRYYKPIRLGKVVIVPKWLTADVSKDETAVYIDPGMAFGTGEHESTQLCIRLLEGVKTAGSDVLDVGAGSGILGITALRLGASHAVLIDVDDTALNSARENAKLNGVEKDAEIVCGDLLAKTDMKADLVFANITADILIRLSAAIYPYIKDGGTFICSGIIHKRAEEVKRAFLDAGLVFDAGLVQGEWQAFRYRKEAK